jgi:L-2,4-diaminobutyrate decarboxylase
MESTAADETLTATLKALEQDAGRDAGALFVDLVCRYFAGPGEGPPPDEQVPAPHAAEPPAVGRPLDEVAGRLFRDVVRGSRRLDVPGYLLAPIGPPLPASVWSEALIGAMNQSLRVHVMSPAATPLETGLVRWMTRLVGWGAGAGGAFTSGATESNVSALLAARARLDPRAWAEGLDASPPVVLAGENVHFGIRRTLGMIGLGTDRLLTVALRDHRIDPAALEGKLREQAALGRRVMAVVATAGSYAKGVFDDLAAVGAVCQRHGVWLHVDAAIGGTALLSRRHRLRLRGIELASSVSWDLHKLALLPLQAGVLLVRDERELENAFAPPHEGPPRPRSPDQFLRSFLNSRRFDALKLWVALERYGVDGLGAIYDHLCSLAEALYERVRRRPDFEPLHAPESSLLCFRYLGEGRRSEAELDALNRRAWGRSFAQGHPLVSASVIDGRAWMIAAVTNPFFRVEDITPLLDRIAVLGKEPP